MSILTGKDSAPRARTAAAAKEPTDAEKQIEAMNATMAALQAQIDRLDAQLGVAHADLSVSRAETAAERAKVDGLRQVLAEEADACGEAEAALAAERAAGEGLRAQLATERDARIAMQASLDQAVAAAGVKQPINMPAYVPPAYELEVVGRDVNERARRIVLKPIKADG